MNLKKLNDAELLDLINTTNNVDLLANAEEEYMYRMSTEEGLMSEFDELTEYEEEFIKKHWRPM